MHVTPGDVQLAESPQHPRAAQSAVVLRQRDDLLESGRGAFTGEGGENRTGSEVDQRERSPQVIGNPRQGLVEAHGASQVVGPMVGIADLRRGDRPRRETTVESALGVTRRETGGRGAELRHGRDHVRRVPRNGDPHAGGVVAEFVDQPGDHRSRSRQHRRPRRVPRRDLEPGETIQQIRDRLGAAADARHATGFERRQGPGPAGDESHRLGGVECSGQDGGGVFARGVADPGVGPGPTSQPQSTDGHRRGEQRG